MRDPARISRILAKLARAWEASPDLRLGQLVHGIMSRYAGAINELAFYTEDNEFEAALDWWLADKPPYVKGKP